MSLTRREFLARSFFGVAGLFALLNGQQKNSKILKEALFYDRLSKSRTRCRICFRGCLLRDGERSFCRNRINLDGRLYSLVYGRPSAIQIDPIEKEPVYHFLPGSKIYCIGTAGCNFRCKFCQNWHLSQRSIDEMSVVFDLDPGLAIEDATKRGIKTISFTYNEPTSCYEYLYDTAKVAKNHDLRVIFHSNGSMNEEPLRELLQYTDAVVIDLKGFTKKFYQDVSGASLEPVLKTIATVKDQGVWLEIVNLLIPELNDDDADLKRMAVWIRSNIGDDVPLHFSRFFPQYRLKQLLPTPIKTLEAAYEIGRSAGLKFISIGNVPGHKHNSTFCPSCNNKLIERVHFTVLENKIEGGRCPFCKVAIPGIWS
ncbi:MAG TPA: AmmeMemoRadiSam system radical SAM enzyme [bacterium (Candidatus Stahlbacteria)]|nr:AmmeMemoRadiSam system radical SAM enzyme [Candidatus Stahlbacteria bacterium]